MTSIFTADFFIGNRQRLREAVKAEVIVVAANGLLQRSGDTTYPFRQDSNFWYLTGIDEPDVVLVMDGDSEYLIVPGRSSTRVVFDGGVDVGLLAKMSGVQQVLDEETGWQRLGVTAQKQQIIAMPLPAAKYIEHHGFYSNPARARLSTRLKKFNAELELQDIRMDLARLRSIKQAPELAAIEQAISISAETFQEVVKHKKQYAHEYEVEAALTHGFRTRGAEGHAYAPIVAVGKNACTLHYIANNDQLQKDELLLIDAGAEADHYAADITRTYALGEPTARQQHVFEAVLKVQEFAMSQLRPGVFIKEYEKAVEQCMGEQLKELGLIKDETREAIRVYYPHATSHFLGLDVHDVGDYEQPLAAGMVLTVEPGIYIREENIGIRLEDNVVITDKGIKVLTAGLPKKLA